MDSELIDLVEKYKFLYDKNHASYKNKLMKEKAWKTIATTLKSSAATVEQRWGQLRHRYAAERRKLKNMPTGEVPLKIWRYYSSMKYLDKFIIPRRSYNIYPFIRRADIVDLNLPVVPEEFSPQHTTESTEVWDTLFQVTNETNPHDESNTPMVNFKKKPSPHFRKIHNKDDNDVSLVVEHENNVSSVLNNALSTISVLLTKDEDEDSLFGKTIGKSLQRISDRKIKARIKVEMLEILEKYED